MSADAIPRFHFQPTPTSPIQAEVRLLTLVDRIEAGHLTACDELYRLTRDEAARALFHVLGQRTDFEAMLREVYLHLFSRLAGISVPARFSPLLYASCYAVTRKYLRWWRRPATGAQGEVVHQALRKLGHRKRIIFVYHELCALDVDDIAEVIRQPKATVRVELQRARFEFARAIKRLTHLEVGS